MLCSQKYPNFDSMSHMLITMFNNRQNGRKAKQWRNAFMLASTATVADLISSTINHANQRCNLCTRKRIAITTLNRPYCKCINTACITQRYLQNDMLRKQEIARQEAIPF